MRGKPRRSRRGGRHLSPSLSQSAIRRYLETLRDVGVVCERKLDDRQHDFPDTFYELNPEARDLFDEHGLFPEDAWRRQYASVEKTARIRDIEALLRPGE